MFLYDIVILHSRKSVLGSCIFEQTKSSYAIAFLIIKVGYKFEHKWNNSDHTKEMAYIFNELLCLEMRYWTFLGHTSN